jgi:hypothetical protein
MFHRFIVRLFLTACLVFPLSADAASILSKKQDYTLQYGLYGGGFQALDAGIRFQFNKTTYAASMDAKPSGALGYLLPWNGKFNTKGLIKSNRLIPQLYTKQSSWRGDKAQTELAYDKNGKFVSKSEGVNKNMAVDPELYKDSVDVLTSIVNMLVRVNDEGTCNADVMTYDGKRRYRMVFRDKGVEELPPSKVNIFKGKARRCQMELIPVAGFKGQKSRGYYMLQEQGRKLGSLPMVWVGPAWEGGPYVPVRILMKNDYGTMLVHLMKATPN